MPKISELNPITTVTDDDLITVVNDPSGAPSTNKITFNNFKKSVTKNIVFANGVMRANTGDFVISSNNTISLQSVVSNSTIGWSELYWTNLNPTPANNEMSFADLYVWGDGMGYTMGKVRQDLNSIQLNEWMWTKDGNFILPSNGDILVDGRSVIVPNLLTPNIEYTGVYGGYPLTLSLTKGLAVKFTSNNYILSSDTKYSLSDRFYSGDGDLSGTQTLNFVNIASINSYFSLGGKGEIILSTVNLKDIEVLQGYMALQYLPSLNKFYANNLIFMGDYVRINNMSNTNTSFYFTKLNHIDGYIQIDNNYNLLKYPQFPALKLVGNINYFNNNSMTDYPIFNSLNYAGSIYINQNSNLTNGGSFPELTNVNNIYFYSNPIMVTPPNFPKLKTVTGYIEVISNPYMTTAPAFPLLEVASRYISFNNNTSLANGFNFTALKQLWGNFTAINCALNQTSVNYILNKLASLDGNNGTLLFNYNVNLSGGTNAPRSSASDAAYANLISRGCTVTLNS